MNYAIIAAGQGSRLVQEGVKRPKPLVELNGEPLIARLIRIFINNGAESISVIINEEMTEVKAFLDSLKPACEMNVVVKTTPSSMHSFYELSKVMKSGKFCLTTVDTVFKEDDFANYIETFEIPFFPPPPPPPPPELPGVGMGLITCSSGGGNSTSSSNASFTFFPLK